MFTAFVRRDRDRRSGVQNGIGKGFQGRKITFLESAANGDHRIDDRDILDAFQLSLHDFTGHRRPGTVLDQADHVVLPVLGFQMMQEIIHEGHDACIVGGCSKDDAPVLESTGKCFGRIDAGKVCKEDIPVGFGIKNVGERAVLDIVSDRDANGRYKSFEDFITRAAKIGIKRNVAEALILASALDFSGLNRAQMVACVQTELDKLTSSAGNNIEGQLSLFDLGGADTAGASVFVPDIPEYPDDVKLGYEKEMVGIYLSGNPLAAYKDTISRLVTFDMAEAADVAELAGMESMDDNREVAMAGLITSKKTGYTKRKTMMATIVCEDLTGSFEVMLYGKSFDEFNRVTEKNKPYLFIGRRQVREGSGISMFVDACYPLTNDEAQINSILSDRAYLTAVKEAGRKKIRSEQIQPSSEPVEVMSDMPEEIVTDEAHASDEGKRNVLRIVFEGSPDSAGFNRLLNFLAYFHGNMTVEVEFASDGSVTVLDNVCAIDPDESVIRKLCDIVGEDNVRFL